MRVRPKFYEVSVGGASPEVLPLHDVSTTKRGEIARLKVGASIVDGERTIKRVAWRKAAELAKARAVQRTAAGENGKRAHAK
jgi:hypothetical protein